MKTTYFALGLLALLAPIVFSCRDGGQDDDGRPTGEEMDEVAMTRCQQAFDCGHLSGGDTVEECIAMQRGSYEVAPDCVAWYYLDLCVIELACEDVPVTRIAKNDECVEELDDLDDLDPAFSCPRNDPHDGELADDAHKRGCLVGGRDVVVMRGTSDLRG